MLTGKALQYRQGTGISVLPLSGGIAPGSHFLVQMSVAGTVPTNGDAALPTPDLVADPAIALGGPLGPGVPDHHHDPVPRRRRRATSPATRP